MSIALVHYHLRPGGVTRVIQAQAEALASAGIPHIVLAGTPPEDPGSLPVEVVPALDYLENSASGNPRLIRELRATARHALGVEPTCWHFHNPVLGKNVHFPHLIAELAQTRIPLVLHLHDLAEDGRPENYQALLGHRQFYPVAPQIRYATVNSRDQSVLLEAGIPAGQVTFLPNPVIAPAEPRATPIPPGEALILYPVRGIRRKNLGEFCLLSAFSPPGTSFALALPPVNPHWRRGFEKWTQLAAERKLPVQMGVVGTSSPRGDTDSSYASWVANSTHLITTSIAEGFGLTFLEAGAIGKPLIGRDLPEITSDFQTRGHTPGTLYQQLLVPRSWVDEKRFRSLLKRSLHSLYNSYAEPLPPGILDDTYSALTYADHLDFGNLPEALQHDVLIRALANPRDLLVNTNQSSVPLPEWLPAALQQHSSPEENDNLEPWSVAHYATLHQELYRELLTTTPETPTWLEPRAVLAQFLKPERFHFLRS